MLRDIKGLFKALVALAPQTVTADIDTAVMDLKSFRNFGFLLNVGAMSFTGVNKIDLKLLHSDDGSTFVACTADDMYTNEGSNIAKSLDNSSEQNSMHLIEYRGNKRYVKMTLEVSGTVSCPIAVQGICTKPQVQPAT